MKLSEITFQAIVEATPNAIVLINKEGKIAYANYQTEKLFGYGRSELINQNVEILIPKRYHKNHKEYRGMYFSSPETRAMGAGRELFAVQKDGQEFPIEIGLNPLVTVEGTMVLASIIDITARKNAEAHFKLVVESAPNAMILVNKRGTIILINKQTEQLFGYPRKELVGQKLEVLIPQKNRKNHVKDRDFFFTSPTVRPMGVGRELYALRKDGSQFPVEVGLNSIETNQETVVLASIIDITEQIFLKNKLESERLNKQNELLRATLEGQEKERSQIGQELHDNVNQILASMKMMLGLVKSDGEMNNDIISKCYDLAGECIQEIRQLSSSLVPNIDEDVNLNDAVNQIIKRLEAITELTFDVEIPIALTSQLSQQQQLTMYRIIQEQLNNVIKHAHAEKVVISLKKRNDDVILTISDNGVGFTSEDATDGIGLKNIRSRCQVLNGDFNISSKPEKGCVAQATIPIGTNVSC